MPKIRMPDGQIVAFPDDITRKRIMKRGGRICFNMAGYGPDFLWGFSNIFVIFITLGLCLDFKGTMTIFDHSRAGYHSGTVCGIIIYIFALFLCIQSWLRIYKRRNPALVFGKNYIEIYHTKFNDTDLECYVLAKGSVDGPIPFTFWNIFSAGGIVVDRVKSNQILAIKPKKMHKCYTFDLDNTCSQEEVKQIISLLKKHHIKKLTSERDLKWFTRNFLPKNHEHQAY